MYTNRTNRMTTSQHDAADRALWLDVAIRYLDADKVEDGYIYRDDATGDMYRSSEAALVKLGRMLERGDDEATAYSEWCTWPGTGELVDA
jgi:hypothetical protein